MCSGRLNGSCSQSAMMSNCQPKVCCDDTFVAGSRSPSAMPHATAGDMRSVPRKGMSGSVPVRLFVRG